MKLYYAAGILWMLILCLTLEGGGNVKKEDVPKYMKMLSSKKASERAMAAEMLGKRGSINVNDVKDAIDPIKTMVREDADTSARKAAASALGAIGPEAQETVPLLAEVVSKDKSLEVKLAAVQALASFGPDAKSALPALRELAAQQKDNKKARQIIGEAQKAIAGKKKA